MREGGRADACEGGDDDAVRRACLLLLGGLLTLTCVPMTNDDAGRLPSVIPNSNRLFRSNDDSFSHTLTFVIMPLHVPPRAGQLKTHIEDGLRREEVMSIKISKLEEARARLAAHNAALQVGGSCVCVCLLLLMALVYRGSYSPFACVCW